MTKLKTGSQTSRMLEYLSECPTDKDIPIRQLYREAVGDPAQPQLDLSGGDSSRRLQQRVGAVLFRIKNQLEQKGLEVKPGLTKRSYRITRIKG